MNSVIETILDHRSIRQYKDEPLTDKQIQTLVKSAQAASTSSYIQSYSIIGVKKKNTKEKLAELAGNQPYVAQNGHLFIFCADLHRHDVVAEMEQKDVTTSLESTEKFMVALIDASLAAQNAAIAAESMGLGVCYIGGLRNNLEEVSELLHLPKRVVPLFGLTVGYPIDQADKKPRLPMEHVYHEEVYESNHDVYKNQLLQYNKQISSYYNERTNGKRKDTWTGQMAEMLSVPTRMYMKEFVEKKGFNRK
ncbi:oxygen-insensitive NADPH nitroreductase [Metabacillus iocasae]|uniref:FMN reductase (NADPH) n=1 Tax=Priestia iocasae TaxID=2291674 RepID=A0ABS2QX33_9BACI|nr:oxygen-insensitive NADPH nitroreductase [Metabacillus iocasae]MBM7703823.1 FMN reductase (NADPH) [Metabacillus iocasae]